MKNTIKLTITAIILLSSINTSFAGSSWFNEIEHKYNGSFNNLQTDTKITLNGYISKNSLGITDDGFGGIDIKHLDLFKESRENYFKINSFASFGAFFSSDDKETNDLNKGLILYGSKDFIKSLNYNDSSYYPSYDYKNQKEEKMYNNGVYPYSIGKVKGINPKSIIIDSVGKEISITGKIKKIDINENVYYCNEAYKDRSGEYGIMGNSKTCKSITSELKVRFLKGYIDSETFKELFKRTWETNYRKHIIINTKIFVLDNIIIDGVTYGQKAYIYSLNSKYKAKFDKVLTKINNLSDSKKESIKDKIIILLEKQRYGRKNYAILSYLKNGMDNYYSIEKKQEAQKILDDIRKSYEDDEDFIDIFNNLLGTDL